MLIDITLLKLNKFLSTEWVDYVEEPMKYQALRPHFFFMVGWVVGWGWWGGWFSWVVGWCGCGGMGGSGGVVGWVLVWGGVGDVVGVT